MPPVPVIRGETAADKTASQQMMSGWQHLQRALGLSLHTSVKRSRNLARANLRRKGR